MRNFVVFGRETAVKSLPGGLYPVATPIGNLDDITLRALSVLAGADLIACEDTRTTRILTERYGIRTPLTAYHEHNAQKVRPGLIAKLAGGAAIALVSDAGTPLISDPGCRLVAEARAAGIAVVPVPGPSAVMAALAGAGLPTDAFLFLGFLPTKSGQRKTRLEAFATTPATLVLFESPRRLAECLADLAAVLGPDRDAAIARELTKKFEEFRTGSLGDLARDYAGTAAPKGEIVVIIGPPVAREGDFDLDHALADALARLTVKDAVAEVAALSGLPRREVYNRALALKPAAGRADPAAP